MAMRVASTGWLKNWAPAEDLREICRRAFAIHAASGWGVLSL
jgi:hypothetical protein